MKSTTGLCAMTLTAAGFLFMAVASAQTLSPSAPPATAPGPKTAPANISDSKLDKAATAANSVSAIRDSFERKLAEAPVAEKQRLVDEANHAMTKAVTDQGLSVEEYDTIIEVAQNDPVVRGKLLQRLR